MTESTTDLAVHEERPNTIAVPSDAEWNRMLQMADRLAQAGMVPRQYQRRPADVLVALVAGRELGMGVMAAMQRIHVIEGKPTLSSEAMVALVLRAGHELVVEESSAAKCTVKGRRIGSQEWQRSTFTIEEAKSAGITGKDNWKKYPAAMLRARAISALCRFAFADVLLGYTYTPDEVGAVTDANDNVIEAEVVEPAASDLPEWIQKGIEKFGEQAVIDASESIRQEMNVGKPITHIDHCRKADVTIAARIVERLERDFEPLPAENVSTRLDDADGVVDAEVVVEHPCPHCGHECMRHEKKTNNKVTKWWACTNWGGCKGGLDKDGNPGPWTSFHNDPWKPGGQIETEFGSKSAAKDEDDGSQRPLAEPSTSPSPSPQRSVEDGTESARAPSLLDGHSTDAN